MGKIVNFIQSNLLPLIRAVNENTEEGTYMLGGEKGAAVGGEYYHVQDDDETLEESNNVSLRGNINDTNTIVFIPHENAFEEGYEKDEIADFDPYYEIEAMDINGNTIMYADLTVEELFDYFPESIVNDIVDRDISNNTRCVDKERNEFRIDDIVYRDTTPRDIDDVDEVNVMAKRIQTGGESAYLLTDGDIISFHDHIQITSIEGMTPSKFISLGNIRLVVGGGIELVRRPTMQQVFTLKSWIRRQDEVYLDIAKESAYTYPEVICGAKYTNPNPNRVVNDILTYFDDGIRPHDVYESKEKRALLENNEVINLAKQEYGITSNLRLAGYILPDGSLLKFGENGTRDVDHRNIEGIYTGNGIEIWNDEYRYNYVVDFMNHGAIRCDVNSGLLDMTQEPTNEQYFVIRKFVRMAGDVDIDFTDDKGDTQHSVSYSDVNPQRVVADIYKYYNEGLKPTGNVAFENRKEMKNSLKENLEFEVDSSDVDLSSFKKQDSLPSIWKDEDTLDSKVRLKLLDIADDFWEYVNVTWVEPIGIIITGSLCNYNWSEYSDVDLHLIVNFNEIGDRKEFVKQYLDSKKNEWNEEHGALKIYGYPVELYVQDVDEDVSAGGVYDLEENKWIRKPSYDDMEEIGAESDDIKEKAARVMTIIDDMCDYFNDTDDAHKLELLADDADNLWKKIKDMRKNGLAEDGEMSIGNIIYKYMRRKKYLDKLFDLRAAIYDKTNTITESSKLFSNKNVCEYVSSLKLVNEEVVADGNSEHNPFEKRWKAERDALKNFLKNFGQIMTSKENGKQYKVFQDQGISNLIGYNYGLCIQWDPIKMEVGATPYIRAMDKFTTRLFQAQFDDRGKDNMRGTFDDIGNSYQPVQTPR